MSEEIKKNSIRDEPWFKNVPEYMGEAIVLITETRDEARMLLAKLTERDQIFADREKALVSAIQDMKDFANRLYGPDSELSKIHLKLDAIKSAGDARDHQHARQLEEIHENQTRLKQWCEDQVRQVQQDLHRHGADIAELQRKIA